MDFDTYEEWAQEECLYIGNLLQTEGLNAVFSTCMVLGKERVSEIVDEYSTEIQQFFHTPRPERQSMLDRIELQEERHVFLVGALHEARCALSLLEAICKYGVTGSAGISKSMILTQSAGVAQAVADGLPKLYPFSEDHPFGMSLGWFSSDI